MIEFDTQIMPTARAMSFLFWACSAFKVRKEFYVTATSRTRCGRGTTRSRCPGRWCAASCARKGWRSCTPRGGRGTARTRARYPMRPRTWSTTPSGPRRPTSCGSPTSRSSGCRAARCTCPDPRLLRRRPVRLADRHEPERGARQQQPRGRCWHAPRRPAPRDPFRSRVPLPLARMDNHMREEPPDQVDVEEGVQPGQLGDGGILRQA